MSVRATFRSAARGGRGYTLLELLVAASIAIIGLYASLALCVSSVRGNTEARNSTVASFLAEHVLATIQGEAVMWHRNPPDLSQAPRYLRHLGSPSPGQGTEWKIGHWNPYDKDKRVGDMGGDNIRYDPGVLLEIPFYKAPRYCIHWRIAWVNPDLVRAEVRVSWPRPGAERDKYSSCPVSMVHDVGSVGSVTLPALVMRNVHVL